MINYCVIHLLLASSALVAISTHEFAARGSSAQPNGALGCYRADRALGTSASANGVAGAAGRSIGEQGASLKVLETFRLLADGRVDRPSTEMRSWWQRGSRWNRVGDSLRVTLSTGTSGWALQLVRSRNPADSTYAGTARYLSDVIVTDTTAWQPPVVLVHVHRESCAGAA